MNSQPPGAARAILIISRAALRRRMNKMAGHLNAAIGRKKKKAIATASQSAGLNSEIPAPDKPRSGTSRKGRGGGILLVFFAAMMLFNGTNLASQFMMKLGNALEDTDSQALAVDSYTYGLIVRTEKALNALKPKGYVSSEQQLERERIKSDNLDQLKQAFQGDYHLVTSTDEARNANVQRMLKIFNESGASGFRIQKGRLISFFPSTDLWPDDENKVINALGIVFLLVGTSLFFMALGSANQDLGRVEWSTEWLFTFPVPGRVLFLAKVFEFAVANTMCWFISFPLFYTVFWCAGYGAWGVLIGFIMSGYVSLIVSALYVIAETWLRNTFAPNQIKNFQAVFSVLGSLLFFGLIWMVASPSGAAYIVKLAPEVPPGALWNPFSLPVLLCARETPIWMTVACLSLSGFAFVLGSVSLSGWMVRDGLLGSSNPYRGSRSERRGAGVATGAPSAWLGGIVGKELRLLFRDRNFLVQTLVVPLLILGFQLVMNPGLMKGAAGNFRHASALAFGLGAYVLIFSSFQVLSAEGNALWMLYTFPQNLYSILLRKTMLWCVFASLYTIATLAVCALANPLLDWSAIPDALTACAGVIIYSLIASGIGVLGTDPLEIEVQRKIRPEMHYLYMLLATMYGYAIYSQSQWSKIAQIILSSLLAFALWQKVRDHTPYLLDPTEEPPPRIGLSDGMIAALAFFVLQGVFFLVFSQVQMPAGAQLVMAFVIAGFLVTITTLYVFWRQNVPDLLRTIGLRGPAGASSLSAVRAVLVGAIGGGAAALAGIFYLSALDWYEPLRILKQEAFRLAAARGDENLVWFALLAVVAAPVFEEYIFRGLVYNGLRRSVRPLTAALASAGVFAIVHPPVSAAPVFCMGFIAAVVFEREKMLLAPVTTHMVYNGIIVWMHSNG